MFEDDDFFKGGFGGFGKSHGGFSSFGMGGGMGMDMNFP